MTPTAPVDPYWEGLGALFLPTYSATGDLVHPPPVVITPSDLAFATGAATFEDLFLEWFLPLEPTVAVDEGRATVTDVERLQAFMATPESAVSRLIAAEAYQRPTPRSALSDTLARVDRTVELLAATGPRRRHRRRPGGARAHRRLGRPAACAGARTRSGRWSPAGSRRPGGRGTPCARRCCRSAPASRSAAPRGGCWSASSVRRRRSLRAP